MTQPPDTVTLSIYLPYAPPRVLCGNGRPAHWAVKNRASNDFHDSVCAMAREIAPTEPLAAVVVKYVSMYCGKQLDRDNLIIGMKPALDALTTARVIEDDSPEFVKDIKVEYERVPHRDQMGVRMEIIEVLT